MNPAARLRAIATLLATRDVSNATRADVAARLATIAAELAAQPTNAPWYEPDASDYGASRDHHDRFGPLRGSESVIAPPLVFGEALERAGVTAVVATARCGVVYEGPPGVVHGGIVAACFDEMLAVAQRDAGVHGLTAELTVRYRRPVHIDTDLVFTAWVESSDATSAIGKAECHHGDDPHAARAYATAAFRKPTRGPGAGGGDGPPTARS